MGHGTKTCMGNKPFAASVDGEFYGLFRAEIITNAAPFAFDFIHLIIFADGIPSAQFPTNTAFCAFIRIDFRHVTGIKIVTFFYLGRHD